MVPFGPHQVLVNIFVFYFGQKCIKLFKQGSSPATGLYFTFKKEKINSIVPFAASAQQTHGLAQPLVHWCVQCVCLTWPPLRPAPGRCCSRSEPGPAARSRCVGPLSSHTPFRIPPSVSSSMDRHTDTHTHTEQNKTNLKNEETKLIFEELKTKQIWWVHL